jgi:hypothetical protein
MNAACSDRCPGTCVQVQGALLRHSRPCCYLQFLHQIQNSKRRSLGFGLFCQPCFERLRVLHVLLQDRQRLLGERT